MSLKEKLVKVIASVDRVKKTGYNKHQNYAYATETDLLDCIREALVENKVVVLTSSDVVDVKELSGKEGKISFLTTVKTTHTILDAESNESFVVTSVGSGHDSLDKSIFKAITGSCKYFWMKTFMISTGDDPEADSNEVQKPAAKPNTLAKAPSFGNLTPKTEVKVAPKPETKSVLKPNFTKKEEPKEAPKEETYEDNLESTEDVAF